MKEQIEFIERVGMSFERREYRVVDRLKTNWFSSPSDLLAIEMKKLLEATGEYVGLRVQIYDLYKHSTGKTWFPFPGIHNED